MKLTTHLILSFILVAGLLACDSAPSPEARTQQAAVTPRNIDDPVTDPPVLARGIYVIESSGQRISIHANAVDELTILNGLAKEAGFELVAGHASWQVITVDLQAATTHIAVVELVKRYPYQIIYEYDDNLQQDVLRTVIVGEPPFPQTSAEAVQAQSEPDEDEAPEDSIDATSATVKRLSPEKQQAYLEQLQDPSPELRVEAAKNIDPVGEALDSLSKLILRDPSPEVRAATTWSLENSEDPKAIDALVMALDDDNLEVVIEAIESLGYAGDETTISELSPFLKHPDNRIRAAAEEAIDFLD